MNLAENRLDPSLLTDEQLEALSSLMQEPERPKLVGREGVSIPLPDAVFHHLVRVIRAMQQGQSILLIPEQESLTTQAAANFLGVSRPFLISLLEDGGMTHHKVGTHRRVYLKDLLDYMKNRDKKRRETLDALASDVMAAGLYEKIIAPENAG